MWIGSHIFKGLNDDQRTVQEAGAVFDQCTIIIPSSLILWFNIINFFNITFFNGLYIIDKNMRYAKYTTGFNKNSYIYKKLDHFYKFEYRGFVPTTIKLCIFL